MGLPYGIPFIINFSVSFLGPLLLRRSLLIMIDPCPPRSVRTKASKPAVLSPSQAKAHSTALAEI